MTFVKRTVQATITLAEGKFSATGESEMTLKGLRMSANIVSYNGDAQGQLHLQVWGLPLSVMNELTAIGPIRPAKLNNNQIRISAGDIGGTLSTVYEGVILSAFGDFQDAPEIVFNIIALSAAFDAVNQAEPKSYQKSVSVASVMEGLATEMGKAFENNGVDKTLPEGTYFSGSTFTQVKECAAAANIYYTIDRGKLAIWPKNGYRKDEPIKVNSKTGLVGYPAFSSTGLILVTLFNPDFALGGRVDVESILTAAQGIWSIYRVSHSLECEMPGGRWMSQIMCYRIEWVD